MTALAIFLAGYLVADALEKIAKAIEKHADAVRWAKAVDRG